MALRELLGRVAADYPALRATGHVRGVLATYRLIKTELPATLLDLAESQRPYTSKGSTGSGNVNPAPWIAVFDRAITTSAQSGYYFVYLFSIDLKRVYACLALGVTEFEKTYGKNRRMLGHLDTEALRLAGHLELGERFAAGNIDLAAEQPTQLHGLYEHSVIVSVEYDTTDLPTDEVLKADLSTLLLHYNELRLRVGAHADVEASVAEAEVHQTGLMTEVPFEPVSTGERRPGGGGSRRSHAAKKIGDAGEKRVVEHERERLTRAGHPDLADAVRWLADEGKQPGYDVLSFNEDGSERWIEVKSSTGDKVTAVDLTEHERVVAQEAPPERYWLYVITRVFRGARLMAIKDPARTLSWNEENPRPVSWSLRLG